MPWSPETLFVLGAVLRELRQEGLADLDIPDEVMARAASRAPRLLETASLHKVLLPVYRAVCDLLPESSMEQRLARMVRQQTFEAMQLAALTGEIASALEHRGCQPVMLKGVTLALRTTGDISSRGRGDVDVLVPAERIPAALEVLKSMGAHTANSEKVTFRIHATTLDLGSTRLDLHHRITSCPYVGTVRHEDLRRRSRQVTLAGHELAVLGDEDMALYLALVGAIDVWSQIIRLADMARLAPTVKANPELARQRADEWGMGAALSLALAVLRRLDSEIPSQDFASEALASKTWRLLASGRLLRWESSRRSLISREVYEVLATRRVPHMAWLAVRGAEVGLQSLVPVRSV